VQTIFDRYQYKVKYSMTFNEINSDLMMPSMGLGFSIQHEQDKYQSTFQALHHQFVASAKAVKLRHEMMPDAQIGCMVIYAPVYAYDSNPENVMFAGNEAAYLKTFLLDFKWEGNNPHI